MKEYLKYDPEDIESLMKHKSFQELYPEEREFVLRYIESEDEYDSMRTTLMNVIASKNDMDNLVIDPSIKENLMAEFATEKKGGFRIWLNSLLAFGQNTELPFYRKPAFQLAFASMIVVIGFLFFFNQNEDFNSKNLAELNPKEKVEDKKEELPDEKANAQEDVEFENVSENKIDENMAEEKIDQEDKYYDSKKAEENGFYDKNKFNDLSNSDETLNKKELFIAEEEISSENNIVDADLAESRDAHSNNEAVSVLNYDDEVAEEYVVPEAEIYTPNVVKDDLADQDFYMGNTVRTDDLSRSSSVPGTISNLESNSSIDNTALYSQPLSLDASMIYDLYTAP